MPNPPTTAYLFPGQGAQYVGLGADLHDRFAVARDTYAEASEALGYDIAALSFRDPGGEINLTRYTQPVLLTHCIACLRVFQQHTQSAAATLAAGHSLGEYCALVAAGALTFPAALKLVKKRGELMGEYGRGEMLALMLEHASAAALAGRHRCAIAACNLPMQTVVGGLREDLDALTLSLAAQFPRARSVHLKTEGAFHTYHMVAAAQHFREPLAQTALKAPQFAVLSNFSGDFHEPDIEAIKSRLFLQLFNPVLWHANLQRAIAGADRLLEFGGGLGRGATAAEKHPNLASMVKKALADAPPDSSKSTGESAPAYLPIINVETLEQAVAAMA